MPRGDEACERLRRNRLDLFAERCERAPAKRAQHVGVDPLSFGAAGPERALNDAPLTEQPPQNLFDHCRAETEALRRFVRNERSVGARVPADDVSDRIGDRLEEGLRYAGRQRCSKRIAIPRCVFHGDPALLPGQDVGAGGPPGGLAQGGIAVERGDHFRGAVGQRGDDAGGGEQNVQDDDHLVRQTLGVQLLLLEEHMQLAHPGWSRRRNMP